MLKRTAVSLKRINYKLFFALLVLGLCPTIYLTVRIFFLGQMPDTWSYSIAGQLSWVNLLYEILNEAIILPLFYFVGKVVKEKAEFSNRVKTGLLLTFGVYLIFAIIISFTVKPLLNLMAANTAILEASASYIRIQSAAAVFQILCSFTLVALITLNKAKYVYILTAARLLLCLVSDIFLVSSLSVSLQLGVNGIGCSNIIVNFLLFAVSIILLAREGVCIFSKGKLSFRWIGEFFKVGSISGLESLVRNIAYMLMIVRMVNVVNEQGVYWVANNFIWGWLLLPVTQLADLIKQEAATNRENIKNNSLGYFALTAVICAIWFVSIPVWKPFMVHILGYADVNKLFTLSLILLGFYVLYAFQNICDATFYGLGKTNYMLFESVVTNSVYYGIAFILYVTGIWVPTLTGIALLFGCGIAFDSIVSFCAYAYLLKKQKLNPFKADALPLQ